MSFMTTYVLKPCSGIDMRTHWYTKAKINLELRVTMNYMVEKC